MSVVQAAHLFRRAEAAATEHYTLITRTADAMADYERASDDYRADLWAFVRLVVFLSSFAASVAWMVMVGKALIWFFGKVV